jgi:hypothetical protein
MIASSIFFRAVWRLSLRVFALISHAAVPAGGDRIGQRQCYLVVNPVRLVQFG